MPISHEKKIIFIHIPKNAGESIEISLSMIKKDIKKCLWGVTNNYYVLQHMSALEIKNHLVSSDIWKNYFKFAVIRNPWSKAVSEYFWYLTYGPSISFSEWVNSLEHRLKINKTINILETGHNIEQYKYIYDNNNNLLIDKILKYENLDTEFNLLMKTLGFEIPLEFTLKTKSKKNHNFKDYYDEKSAKKIGELYKSDIELFEYNFEKTFSNHVFRKNPIHVNECIDMTKYNKIRINI